MPWTRILAAIVFATLSLSLLNAQGMPNGVVGWYNGDWKPWISSKANWHTSDRQFAHLHEDFVVPEGGWTIVGAFAHISMNPREITEAFWEIRGTETFYSGIGPAALTHTETVGGGNEVYLLQVNGLWITLPPGRYWLTVAPVTSETKTYVCATLGVNAIGEPAGTNGNSVFETPGSLSAAVSSGQGGTTSDYSLGVTISAPTAPRDSAWQYNVLALRQEMLALHSTPFPGTSLEDFATKTEELITRAPSLSDAEMRTGLQALVASIGDPHTDVIWPTPRPYQSLPLSLYWFDDGVYVTGAPEQYQQLLGTKLTGIGNNSIEEAIDKLTPLTPHDNDSWLRQVIAANKLTNTDFLYGTRVIDAIGLTQVRAQNAAGEALTVDLDPSVQAPLFPAFQGDPPLYRQHPERRYWATVIDDGATLYFQYNSCGEDPQQPSKDFFEQLTATMAQPEIRRVILDMRNNSGGSATILKPWLEQIQASRFNQAGRLYVIVGRATYSAAMEAADRLREDTLATFVGEPTGGKPRFLLRKGDFGLPYFGIRVSFSNGVERANDPGPTLMPDIRVPVTFVDYMNGTDPALNAILATTPVR